MYIKLKGDIMEEKIKKLAELIVNYSLNVKEKKSSIETPTETFFAA